MHQRVFYSVERCRRSSTIRGLITHSIYKIWKHMSKRKRKGGLVTFQIVATANEQIWIYLLKHFLFLWNKEEKPGSRGSNPSPARGMSLTSFQFHHIFSFNCDSVSNHPSLQYLIPAASSLICLLLSLSSFPLHFEHFPFLSFALPEKFGTRQPSC